MHKPSEEKNTQKIIQERYSVFPLVLESLKNNPSLKSIISTPFQLNLIVDANIIIRELIWLTQKRKKETALTRFLEIMQTKIVTAVAPVYLAEEIEKKIPVISKREKIPKKRLFMAWGEYRKYITFIEHKNSPELNILCERDPKDSPYLALNFEYGYPVYTEDKDISGMGGTVITAEFISNYRDYTKNAHSAYTIQIVGIGSIVVADKIVQSLFSLISKIPKKGLILFGAIIVILLIYKPTREYILSKLEKIQDTIPLIIDVLSETIGRAIDTYKDNFDNSEEKKNLLISYLNNLQRSQLDLLN